MMQRLKQKARQLKRELGAIYLASKDPRVPLSVRILAICIIAYALSPIDLIPDFIPVLGYLDDLILIPLGIALILKLIPATVLQNCRASAERRIESKAGGGTMAAVAIVAIWLLIGVSIGVAIARL